MTKKDDLGLWRMYGEDTKGVSLRYEVNEPLPEGFCLAKVSYAKRDAHAELTYLASKLCKALKGRSFEVSHLHSWLHFFKPEEYAMEEEVRLLYLNHVSSSYPHSGMKTGRKRYHYENPRAKL